MKTLRKALILIIALALSVLMLASCGTIPTGYTGIKIVDSVVQDETVPVGRYGALGANTRIVTVNNQRQTYVYNEHIDGEADDQTVVWAEGVAIIYQIKPEASVWIYKNVPDYENHIIPDVKIASSVKNAMANISVDKVTNRSYIEPAVKNEIQSAIDTLYAPDMVEIIDVSISSMDYEQSYNDAIAKISALRKQAESEAIENQMKIDRAKAEAEAEATKAEAQKKTAEANAEIARINAESYAETHLIESNADIERMSKICAVLTPEYIEYLKWGIRWNGILPERTNGEIYVEN